VASDERLLAHMPADALRDALEAEGYVGDAPERARALAALVASRASFREA
jgi:hypothetical protein